MLGMHCLRGAQHCNGTKHVNSQCNEPGVNAQQGPHVGAKIPGRHLGRRTGVPETTTDELRP